MDLFETLKQRSSHVVPEEGYVPDLQGWMPTQFPTVFSTTLNERERVDIVEVGTWKGTSAIEMATVCSRMGIPAKIICVDTWLGSPEHFSDNGRYDDLYNTFVKNVKSKGFGEVIVPLALPSLQAIEVLKKYQVRPDVIYIDAAHEYLPVKMDMDAYWEILKPGGFLLGDDYHHTWPGVFQAVSEFVAELNDYSLFDHVGSTWGIKKPCLSN
jgi:predicted O-methyltransferase YrrM